MKKKLKFITLISLIAFLCITNQAFSQEKINIEIDSLKTDTSVFTVVENFPEFPGGDKARIDFLVKNMVYPKKALENGIKGTVYITFIVEKNGSISNVRILRGIGGGCDEEAMRVIKQMPKWKPARQRGKNVRVQFNLPISFTLSEKNEKK